MSSIYGRWPTVVVETCKSREWSLWSPRQDWKARTMTWIVVDGSSVGGTRRKYVVSKSLRSRLPRPS